MQNKWVLRNKDIPGSTSFNAAARMNKKSVSGFTLLEILIALFIFTILSIVLVGALHTVINADSGTEKNAYRLRDLQMVFLTMGRNIEQTVNRPILNAAGEQDEAFVGSPRNFTFTHTGFSNPTGKLVHSSLERTQYGWSEGVLWRKTWAELDQAPQALPHSRALLSGVLDANFQYLDKDGHFQNNWPPTGGREDPLPRAVKIYLSIKQWGKISQLYVIYAQPTAGPVQPKG
jgi:general secretion pathway protein J